MKRAAEAGWAAAMRAFSFPLNVYAHLLQQLEGQADYLHFAVFEPGQNDVRRAQERASELLWQALPPPCRLLEVGIGLGTTLARLRAAGYDAHGITPEPAQIDAAHARHGAALPLTCSRLEDYADHAGQWHALLFQESAQYIAPLALFEAAERLLAAGPATLVVMDEFALKREEPGQTGLHHLAHFQALAARFGWQLEQHIDLSQAVQPTLDYLLRTTRSERDALMRELGLDAAALDGLDAALLRSQALYRQGVYGYALLRYTRPGPAAARPVALDAARADAMRELFARVFGHAMSADEWRWKYGDGRGHAVGLQRDGELVAHFGGMSRRVHALGQDLLACQVCDVMVAPQARASLNGSGPLLAVTATFLEQQIGWGTPHALGFGFPTTRAFRVAEKLGLYREVDQMVRLESTLCGTPEAHRTAAARVDDWGSEGALDPGQRAIVDELWSAMRVSAGARVLGVRDAAWIEHRYRHHPSRRYRLLLLRSRWWRRPVGLAVLRTYDDGLWRVVDLVAPVPRLSEMLGRAAAWAGTQEASRVECWITRSQLPLLEGALTGVASVHSLEISVPESAWTEGLRITADRRWLLMAGDADFT